MGNERQQIVEAQRIARKIQREQEQARIDDQRRKMEEKMSNRNKADATRAVDERQQNKGAETRRKRKSMGDLPEAQGDTPRKVLRTTLHRRLQSQATVPSAPDRTKVDIFADLEKKPRPLIRNMFSGRPHNGYLFPMTPSKTRDRTKTDHFRLKALGHDPDTAVVPHTSNSLAAAQRDEELKRRAAMVPPRVKRGAVSTSWNKQLVEWESKNRTATGETKQTLEEGDSGLSRPALTQSGVSQEQMDKWEKSTREMQEMTEWLRNERIKMENAEKQDLVPSHGTQNSNYNVQQPDSDGLITVHGYKVRPFPSTPGKPLNRMEQRIMTTGGRGLYTAPIPGTPEYKSLSQSKYHRLRQSLGLSEAEADQLSNSPPLEKGVLQDILTPTSSSPEGVMRVDRHTPKPDCTSEPLHVGSTARASTTEARNASTQRQELVPKLRPNPKSHTFNKRRNNHFAVPDGDNEQEEPREGDSLEEQSQERTEEDEEELLEDDSDVDEHDHQDDSASDDEEYNQEDYVREDDDAAGSAEGDSDDEYPVNDLQSLARHAYLDLSKGRTASPAAAIEMSRGTSGTGASADDALVLSDSD